MFQVAAVLFALILIPILLKCKVPNGWALIIAAAAAVILGRLPLMTVLQSFLQVFTEWSNLSSVLIIIEIATMGALMTRYGLFKRAEEALKAILPRPRLIIMLLPSVIGMLQVPGGAALSAPFCNNLGSDMGLTRSQRANTNVICRHVFMMCAPFSTSVLIVTGLAPQLNLPLFLLTTIAFTAVMLLGNYVFFLRKSKEIQLSRVPAAERARQLGVFFLMISPIWVVVALKLVFGLHYTLAVPVGVLVVYLLCDRKDFLKNLAASYNLKLTIMIVGIYFFQNVIKNMAELQQLVYQLLTNGSEVVFMAVIALAAVLFGLASGLMYTSLGILAPIIVSVSGGGMPLLVNMFYVFCWSYIGYVFSPLHMCQILSDQECGCTIGERYRTYIPMILLLLVDVVAIYGLLSLLLL